MGGFDPPTRLGAVALLGRGALLRAVDGERDSEGATLGLWGAWCEALIVRSRDVAASSAPQRG